MTLTKYDNELWYVQLIHNRVEILTIPTSQRSVYKELFIFEEYEDAEKCQKAIHEIYFETFQRRPYVGIEKMMNNFLNLVEIELAINEALEDYPNFDGIDFCDVSASGIQIRGHHKQVRGYCYGVQPTIKYDFSNYNECIDEFVDAWKAKDNVESLKQYNSFLEAGERWGWD